MNLKKHIYTGFFLLLGIVTYGQNLHYFFVDGIYQRSYFNPALNNSGNVSLAIGAGVDFATDGPGIGDVTSRNEDGNLILSAANAISEMNEVNDIFGYSSVNTFDASVNLPFVRVSIGHAWKAQGWLEYTKDLAEFVTLGNGNFVGQTLNLSPQVDYINYNEIYLGLQKDIGPLSIGVNIKRLSGVEAIRTESHKIDLTTSDDIYQLTLDTDFDIRSSGAFTYTDIENFNFNIENFSFDHFLSKNSGWAFDIGAAVKLSDRLELSLSILDLGSINWDEDPKIYSSKKVQKFDGIDVSESITSETEFIILDSIKALLDLEESSEVFTTTLPSKIFLGGRLKISDLWTVGALLQSSGSGDRRVNVAALNATTQLYKFLSAGVLYSIKKGHLANIGLHVGVTLGPVKGFVSTDNIFQAGSFNNTTSSLRLGLSLKI